MKKRILIFSTAYFPLVGGAEVAVQEITNRLSDFDFVMITAKIDPALKNEEKIGNVTVYRVGKGSEWDKFCLLFAGVRKARELGKFDAVWSIMASYAGFAALRYKKQNPTVPFLLTLQEGDSKWDIYKHVWWCWPYFKQIFQRADKIQAISNYLAKWAKDLGARCEISVIPNGVDVGYFKQPVVLSKTKDLLNVKTLSMSDIEYQILNIKKNLGLSVNDKIIITISRLVKKNGVGDLIRAINFFNIQYPMSNIHLLVVGDGVMKQKLIKLTDELKIQDRIHFLGHQNHEELPKYLWMSDVFCRPSLSEGLGNVFLEAMAAGVPVIGTKVGGIPDFLVEEKTGLFCEVKNPESIAQKIKQLFSDPALVQKLKINGYKLIAGKYNFYPVSLQMYDIFKKLCEKKF